VLAWSPRVYPHYGVVAGRQYPGRALRPLSLRLLASPAHHAGLGNMKRQTGGATQTPCASVRGLTRRAMCGGHPMLRCWPWCSSLSGARGLGRPPFFFHFTSSRRPPPGAAPRGGSSPQLHCRGGMQCACGACMCVVASGARRLLAGADVVVSACPVCSRERPCCEPCCWPLTANTALLC